MAGTFNVQTQNVWFENPIVAPFEGESPNKEPAGTSVVGGTGGILKGVVRNPSNKGK